MVKFMLAMLFAVSFAAPVSAAEENKCYGPKARALAERMLVEMPGLRYEIQHKRAEVLSLRHDACAIVAQMQKAKAKKHKRGHRVHEETSIDVDSMHLLTSGRWKSIWMAAERRGLNPYAVFAATVDATQVLPPALFFQPRKKLA